MDHLRILVCGMVQGVGFRPFVWRLARELQLHGWVRNDGSGVEIEVHGSSGAIEAFLSELNNSPPKQAKIDRITKQRIETRANPTVPDDRHFRIVESTADVHSIPRIPPDVATCDVCLEELLDSTNRRYLYPFIQCNDCGPRYSIAESLPFDRANTTMRQFPMCEDCQAEFLDPYNRRFHSQTIACPACGPSLWWESIDATETKRGADQLSIHSAIRAAIQSVKDGRIVAIHGIGGFHLACDAQNEDAVQKLRGRKGRGAKPFAVMVRDLDMAGSLVQGCQEEWQLLSECIGPIVTMTKTRDDIVSESIAPGLSSLGILLPYSPIHHLLMRLADGPWVMTSGNRADEPIATNPDQARICLDGIADAFLMHDRPIANMCDDSVVRITKLSQQMIRRSRGFLMNPIKLAVGDANLLAVGADMKGAFCLVKHGQAYVSAPLGDLQDRATLDVYIEMEVRMERMLNARPEGIVADLHPAYVSSQWAKRRASELGIPCMFIQHHHAHLGALAAEHAWEDSTPLLGWVFDGTGYGSDGTIWGGEAFLLERGSFARVTTLEHFLLPGGDTAVRFPFRTALALLYGSEIDWTEDLECVTQCQAPKRDLLKKQLDQHVNVARTSSMGRLFDGVASLLGVRHAITYEAQAAIELEEFALRDNRPTNLRAEQIWLQERIDPIAFSFPTKACIRELVDGMRRGLPRSQLAHWFHRVVAAWMVIVASRVREDRQIQDIGLTGGVFQNRLLTSLAVNAFRERGFRVLAHESWPCHDGSIGLGQAWIATRTTGYREINIQGSRVR